MAKSPDNDGEVGNLGLSAAYLYARQRSFEWRRKGADRRRVKREHRKAFKRKLAEIRRHFGIQN